MPGTCQRARYVNRRSQILTASLGLAFALPAHAQVSAGQILNNLRNEQRQQQTLPSPVPAASAPQAPTHGPAAPPSVHFVVRRMRFVGAPRGERDALRKLVAPYLNRSIDFATLQEAANRVAEYCQRHGHLVHVLFPEQDITAGVVTLRIMTARLGAVVVRGAPRGDEARLENWVYAQVPRGQPIDLPALERALLLLDDLPEFEVYGSLARGSQAGLSDVDLQVAPRPALQGAVSVDNYGASSTGRTRLSAQLEVNGVLGFGTRIGLNAMRSSGTRFAQVDLGLPVRDGGWRVGIDASRMQYKVLGSTFQALSISGSTTSAGLHASYPLLRSRPANLLLRLGWEFNAIRSANAAGAVADQSYDTRVAHAEFDGNWLAEGINTGTLRLVSGNIGRDPAGNYNGTYQVAGNFAKLACSITHTQDFVHGLSGYASLSGQLANRNLDSSEQMYLGGPYAMRAYASGQLPATQGALLSLQLRHAWWRRIQSEVFYDAGTVQTWKGTSAANDASNRYTVQDAGIGLTWRGPLGSSLTASWAWRLGHLDPSVASYLQLNGGLARNRVWLTASLPFAR